MRSWFAPTVVMVSALLVLLALLWAGVLHGDQPQQLGCVNDRGEVTTAPCAVLVNPDGSADIYHLGAPQ